LSICVQQGKKASVKKRAYSAAAHAEGAYTEGAEDDAMDKSGKRSHQKQRQSRISPHLRLSIEKQQKQLISSKEKQKQPAAVPMQDITDEMVNATLALYEAAQPLIRNNKGLVLQSVTYIV